MGAGVGQRRLRRFLHHVAQRAGQLNLAGSFAKADFDGQDVAADVADCQPGGHADLVALFGHAERKLFGAEEFFNVIFGHGKRSLVATGDLDRQFANGRADTPFQLAHACFSSVMSYHLAQGVFLEGHLGIGHAVGFKLFLDQIAFGDSQFFIFDVARHVDGFHSVQQRRRDGRRLVGGGDEDNLAQVEGHLEVVIGEGVVLLGVENL